MQSELNPMCYDCKQLNSECKGTKCQAWTGCLYKEKGENKAGFSYYPKNYYWSSNTNIRAKFSRLNYSTDGYIYVGLLTSCTGWRLQDYIDIMSYFDCVGFMKISEEEAKEVSMLPTGNFSEFLKLEKHSVEKPAV